MSDSTVPWDNSDTPNYRYTHDPEFKQLTDLLESFIRRCDFTPSEVRQAAMLACINYEMMRTDRRYYKLTIPENAENAISILEEWGQGK